MTLLKPAANIPAEVIEVNQLAEWRMDQFDRWIFRNPERAIGAARAAREYYGHIAWIPGQFTGENPPWRPLSQLIDEDDDLEKRLRKLGLVDAAQAACAASECFREVWKRYGACLYRLSGEAMRAETMLVDRLRASLEALGEHVCRPVQDTFVFLGVGDRGRLLFSDEEGEVTELVNCRLRLGDSPIRHSLLTYTVDILERKEPRS